MIFVIFDHLWVSWHLHLFVKMVDWWFFDLETASWCRGFQKRKRWHFNLCSSPMVNHSIPCSCACLNFPSSSNMEYKEKRYNLFQLSFFGGNRDVVKTMFYPLQSDESVPFLLVLVTLWAGINMVFFKIRGCIICQGHQFSNYWDKIMQIVDDHFLYLMKWLLIHLFSTMCWDAYSDTMLGYACRDGKFPTYHELRNLVVHNANSIRMVDGGTHIDGTKAALTRTLNSLGKKSKSIKVHFFFHFTRGFLQPYQQTPIVTFFFPGFFRVWEVFD